MNRFHLALMVSRRGGCEDNVPMKNTIGLMKSELVYLAGFAIRKDAKWVLFRRIERYCNRWRRCLLLG